MIERNAGGGPEDLERQRHVHDLLIQHQVMLGGFLFMLCEDWDAAEEALQETAGFICMRWRDYEPGTDFRAWARAIGRNLLKETLRKRAAARRGAGLAEAEGVGPVSEEEWDRDSAFSPPERDALSHCLDRLPGNVRLIVDRRYVERWSCQRIADHLHRGLDAVYKTLSRARVQLRQCIEQRARGEAGP
jgi:RNA polymerase sigma-70 factor (ECF subfamily)